MQSFGTGVGQYQLHMLVVEDNLFRELDQSGFFRPNDLNIRITMAKSGQVILCIELFKNGRGIFAFEHLLEQLRDKHYS